jgi:dTMP kinase
MIDLTVNWLVQQGRLVVRANDQSTEFGKVTRRMHLYDIKELTPLAETYLIAAMRVETLHRIVLPAIAANQVVIAERYADAVLAFGRARSTDEVVLKAVHESLLSMARPDATILLDASPDQALARIDRHTAHRVELEPLAFHRSLRDRYREISTADPTRVQVLNAQQPASIVWQELKQILTSLFS